MYSNKSHFSIDFLLEREGGDLDLHVTGSYAYDPGRCSGPPENCYPPEEDMNYNITLGGIPWDGDLSTLEQDALESLIRESLDEDYEDPAEEYDRELAYEYDEPYNFLGDIDD